MPRNARPVALPLELAPSGAPLRHRVADALIDLLRTGHLRPGDTLPRGRSRPSWLEGVGLAVDVLGQSASAPLDRQALVCGYALLPETQARAAAAAIASSLRP